MQALLRRTYHGSKISQFDTGSTFLSKMHISTPLTITTKRSTLDVATALDSLLSAFIVSMPNSAMLLKAHNQFSKKFVDKFCSPFFMLSIIWSNYFESSQKNVSNMLCLVMRIFTEKKYSVTLVSLNFH